MLKNWAEDRKKTNIVFWIFIVSATLVSYIIAINVYSIFKVDKNELSSNIFGLTSKTVSIEKDKDGILNDVAYIFNMQENETSVITNDNEFFFIREILNNESNYLVLIKTSEGVKSILLDDECFNQNELLKDYVKNQIEILRKQL